MTFDAGQTLVELDTQFLARRLAERGRTARPESLDHAVPGAWRAYEAGLGTAGHGAGGDWKRFMAALLGAAGIDDAAIVDWLWTEQPAHNLWRRPIPGMIELVDDLRRAGIAVGVVSNSEGRLAELFAEIGWSDRFGCVADSGLLALEKPDPRIFAWTLERLGVAAAASVHVGDSWTADIAGARGAGLRAIWFGPHARAGTDPGVVVCADAAGVRAALRGWGARV